jgi:hypothetical protein
MINEGHLESEKKKLMRKSDGFQVIEYIRSSIEIIMNLKVEDLEREINQRSLKIGAGIGGDTQT